MALERKTKWICDTCNAFRETESTDDKKGLDEPYGWSYRTIRVSASSTTEWARQVLMCNACLGDFQGIISLKPESKKILKKPFWQKLLRITK